MATSDTCSSANATARGMLLSSIVALYSSSTVNFKFKSENAGFFHFRQKLPV